MFPRFSQRSLELEHLDKGDFNSEEYEGCLIELRRVNRWLGDTRALRASLLKEIEDEDLQDFSVIDVGAGSGELLRLIARSARRAKRQTQLVGVELNPRSASAIAEESEAFPEIESLRGNAFQLPFADNAFDYAICSLFTHHFKNDDVVRVLRELSRVASRKIFVIDLHRHPIAYFFYTTLGHLFLHNRLIREDGALSILRSFKPDELKTLAKRAGLEQVKVERHFPYRLVLTAQKGPAAIAHRLELGNQHFPLSGKEVESTHGL